MSISDLHAGSAPEGLRSAASPLALGAPESSRRGRRGCAGPPFPQPPAGGAAESPTGRGGGCAGAERETHRERRGNGAGNAPGAERERSRECTGSGEGTEREPGLARRPRRGWREAAEKEII
ncbi:uncharacterized protein GJ701_000260 isoform 2-T9 [Geothlypis trichas]